ncbi:MAG: FGGY-family carbohydrate kinase [Acidimicrobiia bacterium]|nr:FGGY-family carbohydrate kinase [Acidimicrobiia bacterium]
MPEGVVVGVDVGSGSARAVAIDSAGAVLDTATAPYPARDGFAVGEADPAAWMEGLSAAVGALDCETPIALCVGGHAPNTVASTGELAITFRNPAGAADGQVGQHAAHAALLRKRLGDHVEPRHMWDYLLGQLGGRTDVQSVWPPQEPLADYGDPVPVGSGVGTSTGAYGIPAGVVLVPGSHDGLLTAWAASIDTPGRAFDPGGRTGGLGVAVDAVAHAEIAKFGMPSQVPGVAIVGGPVASHGAIMDWWSQITGRSVADLLDLAAAVEPGAGGVIVLPFLEGERAPRWNLGLRADIIGLSLDSDVGVVTRALLESTAYGLGHIARALADQGVPLQRVVCSGGPARSALWTSIKAAVLEVPVDVPACDEMAAYGAALGAGAAVGWWPRPGEGKPGDWPMPEVTTYLPEPLDVYRNGLDRFIALGDEAVERLERTKTK